MKPKQPWFTHILRGALILIATALLTLAILQRAIVDPHTCQAAIDAFTRQPWAPTLAQATLSAVPESTWTPYLPHDANILTRVYAKSIDPRNLEAPICTIATSVSRYWLGIETGDTVRNAILDLVDHLGGDWAEHTRAVLWESLPTCTGDIESSCVAADLDIRRQQAIEHTAWWNDYLPRLQHWLGNAIIALVNTIPLLQPWIMQLHLLDILPIVLLILGSAGVPPVCLRRKPNMEPGRPRPEARSQSSNSDEPKQNTTHPSTPLQSLGEGGRSADRVRIGQVRSLPFLITGAALALLSIIALFANLPAPRNPLYADAHLQPVTDMVWQSLWRALLPSFGWHALTLGAILFSVGLILTAITVQIPWQRWLLLTTTIVLVTGALMLDQVYRNEQTPIVINTNQATPTAWPSLTPTPPPTSTPTPTPPVYWPVQTGTPMPTPAASLDSGLFLSNVACIQAPDDAPIQHIHAESTGFTVFQPESYTRYALPSLSRISHRENAHALDENATYLVNQRVALTEGENLWVFNIPTWTPAMPTRFATFAEITSVYGDPHTNTNRLLLGLEDGFVWEVRPSTGALLAMRDVSDLPIRNLVQCRDYLVFQDNERTMNIWNWSTGEELHQIENEDTALFDLTCNGDQHITSLDIQGGLVTWELSTGTRDRIGTIGAIPVTPFLHHNDRSWTGTRDGHIISVEPETLDIQHYDLNANAITTFAILENNLIFTGASDGSVCLWSSVDVE